MTKRKLTYPQALALAKAQKAHVDNLRRVRHAQEQTDADAKVSLPKSREELRAEREAEELASTERWLALENRRRAEEL